MELERKHSEANSNRQLKPGEPTPSNNQVYSLEIYFYHVKTVNNISLKNPVFLPQVLPCLEFISICFYERKEEEEEEEGQEQEQQQQQLNNSSYCHYF
ncbi:unnamed protein product [Schistosoma spindalis]|nr:unnamed protein product [Schistosoma spindale]